MGTTIYYFTGTGNSLKVAKDLSDQLKDTKLVQISKKNMSITSDVSSDKIGFVFPVYFSGIPAMLKAFLEKLQINKNAYVFAIATFGGQAGISLNQIENILNKKGVNLSAGFKVAMPGNYQVMYSPFSVEKQQQLFKEENEKIIQIADSIKRNEIVKSNSRSELLKKAVGGLLYNSFKPKDKDKNFWADERCNGCGTCSKVCPANNIIMSEGKPQWQHQCETCMACMQWCPQESIQYNKNTVKRGRYHHPDIKTNELF